MGLISPRGGVDLVREKPVADTREIDLLDANEVAEILRLHPQTVRRLVREKRLNGHLLGNGALRRRGLRIPKASVDRYLVESAVR
ncbi:helix-turn-helix domain-containing protein [Streptomyces sp. NPDC087901]|uniref:helix-turn-helix domain-containing protein n=1 Tax=Streptomyces sp. NPDC087901 TaxID=3365818 RepID=UPI0038014886